MVTRDQQGKRYADLIAEADEAFVKKYSSQVEIEDLRRRFRRDPHKKLKTNIVR